MIVALVALVATTTGGAFAATATHSKMQSERRHVDASQDLALFRSHKAELRGERGPAGATNVTVHRADVALPAGDVQENGHIACPAGQRATGGGFNSGAANAEVTLSAPTSGAAGDLSTDGTTPTGWVITAHSALATTGRIWVICAAP
jgi:hypothetical protein